MIKTLALLSTDEEYEQLSATALAKFKTLTHDFLKRNVSAAPFTYIVVFGDAKTGAGAARHAGQTILKGSGTSIIGLLKKFVMSAGRNPKVIGYRFDTEFKEDEVARACKYLREKGTIVVALGGNTFTLNSGIRKVPILRDLLIDRVKKGSVMYSGYSAGAMLAGTDISESRDSRPQGYSNEGLGLIAGKINPHNGNRNGTRLVDGQMLCVEGSKTQVV